MTLVFLNGGEPDYTGYQFSTAEVLLTAVKTNLEAAGWFTEVDEIAASFHLLMRGTDNGDDCWVDFSVENDLTETFGKSLIVRGDLLGDGTSLSPKLSLPWIDTASNLLWITVDASSGCVATRSYSGEIKAAHFGFLDRPAPSLDPYGWMVGYLHADQKSAYFAKLYNFEDQEWKTPCDTGQADDLPFLTTGTIDRYTVAAGGLALFGNDHSFKFLNDSRIDNKNPAVFANYGSLNRIDDKPILGDYYYQQGKIDTDAYHLGSDGYDATFQTPAAIYFRGGVKYAVVGLASISAGIHVVLSNGHRYLSGGSRKWQGFRIA